MENGPSAKTQKMLLDSIGKPCVTTQHFSSSE